MTVEQELKESEARIIKGFDSGDLDSIVAEHTPGVLVLPFDSPVKSGSDAVRSDFKELIDAGWKNLSMETVEIDHDGDLAYQVGTFAVDAPPAAGGNRMTGKFVDVHKRQPDGSWKIHVTSFSFDKPM